MLLPRQFKDTALVLRSGLPLLQARPVVGDEGGTQVMDTLDNNLWAARALYLAEQLGTVAGAARVVLGMGARGLKPPDLSSGSEVLVSTEALRFLLEKVDKVANEWTTTSES